MTPTPQSLGFSEDNFSWDQYDQTRPAYPESLLRLIYDFHEASTRIAESDRWGLAMDIGAGQGVLSEHLIQRFDHVAVVEPNQEYLEVAKRRLLPFTEPTEAKLSFFQSGAEDEVLPANSSALLLMGMCNQWTDTQKSIAAAAHHLKPGGTMAIVFYRRPYLVGNPHAADIWDEIWDAAVGIMMETGEMDDTITDRAWRLEDNGLDCVPVPCPPFRPGVRRIKMNAGTKDSGGLSFAASLKHARPANSALGQDDVIQYIEDAKSWRIKGVTSSWLMKAFKSYLAGLDLFDNATEQRFVARLDQAMKGSGDVADAVHPVSVILASKDV